MLPRFKWKYSENVKSMNKACKRLNNFAANRCVQTGGFYLRHPDIIQNFKNFLDDDGIHLKDLGNDLFLNDIVGGIEFFLNGTGNTFAPL